MASSSKRQKFTVSLADVSSKVDIISTLPDHTLSHILSFLPTKYAVATSILSTRWKHLWTSVSNLDFDHGLFGPVRTNRFSNFVDSVFMLIKSSYLNSFRLNCCHDLDVFSSNNHDLDGYRVNLWVIAALSRNVRNLYLCLSIRRYDMLPSEIFNSKTLVVLKLDIRYGPPPAPGPFRLRRLRSVCLPSLEVLHLHSIKFLDDTSTQKLISSCPVLEELEIHGCSWQKELRGFHVSARALQRLSIQNSFNRYRDFQLMVIDAPNLLYLRYFDAVPVTVSVLSLKSLVKADISLPYGPPFYDGITRNLMKAIASVKHLNLSMSFLKEESNYIGLPMFPNLISLELGGEAGWKMLPHLLEHSCHVERLVLKFGISCEDFEGRELCHGFWLQKVPSCLSFHLKTIELFSFSGSKGQLEVVKYFLNKAKVLEKLMLHGSKCLPEKEVLKATKELLMLPRGSRKCQVAIL